MFVLTCIIQITPAIKWNPLSSLAGWVGKQITKDVQKEVEAVRKEMRNGLHAIEEKVDEMEMRQITDEKDRIRFEVLDFANSCRNHCKHTKDEFQHIFDLNDKYESLLEETNDTNGVFTAEFEYIQGLYRRCQSENSFLA